MVMGSGEIQATPNLIDSTGEVKMMPEDELERYYAEYLSKEELPA